MGGFLLSIVIPTRNRAFFAERAARQVLEIGDPRIQVIVQDNSDEPGLEDNLKDLTDSGALTYVYHPGMLSFVDNFEAAVTLAQGEYVCVIGDDDGVAPGIIEVVEWAARHLVEAVVPSLDVVYYWPGSVDKARAHLAGSLVVSTPNWTARLGDPRRAVVRLARRGGLDYTTLPLVKIYHGIVRRELIEEVWRTYGKCFGGLSPDIYSAVVLSLVAKSVVIIGWPLTIPGICRTSGSGDSASGKHTGRLQDAPHFNGHEGYRWSRGVPAVYCVETIWADSMLAALRDMGQSSLIEAFGYGVLERVVKSRHPELRNMIDALGGTRYVFRHLEAYAIFRAQQLSGRVKLVLSGKHRRVQCTDIVDIGSAAKAMGLVLQGHGSGYAALERVSGGWD